MLGRMRVIAGEFRSRRLQVPPGSGTRPTSDRLRESLFSVLQPRLEGARFLDLYAGSGAVGIEALSRGAAFVQFAESAPAALRALRANLASLGIVGRHAIEDRGVARALGENLKHGRGFDLVFLDPPYEAAAEYAATLRSLAEAHGVLLRPGALIVAEHSRRGELPESVGALERNRQLKQGDACLSFYAVNTPYEVNQPA